MSVPEQRAASRTAVGVALLRAMHQLHDASPKILDDPIVPRLLDEGMLRQAQENLEWHRNPRTAALRSHVVLRSRYAEDCLEQAVSSGVRQYVILGSGFDTFAYRQPAWAAPLRIFEVDHTVSQQAKLERLRSSSIPIPANLEFVSADFELSSLKDILARSFLNFRAPAFFSSLGVLVYLPQDSIKEIFQLVAAFPRNSELVFTFSQAEHSDGDKGDGPSLAEEAAMVGEPWRSYHDRDTLRRELLEAGFSRVSFLSPEEAESLYYRDRSDGLPPPRRSSIARAVV